MSKLSWQSSFSIATENVWTAKQNWRLDGQHVKGETLQDPDRASNQLRRMQEAGLQRGFLIVECDTAHFEHVYTPRAPGLKNEKDFVKWCISEMRMALLLIS